MLHLCILPGQIDPRFHLRVESSQCCVISQIALLTLLRIQGRAVADRAGVGGSSRRHSLHGMDKILIFLRECGLQM